MRRKGCLYRFVAYVFLVAAVQYFVLLTYFLQQYVADDSLLALRNFTTAIIASESRTTVWSVRDGNHGNNSSSRLRAVNSTTQDHAKLILVQERLTACYRQNMTDAGLEKCLEREYYRARGGVIVAAAEEHKRLGVQPGRGRNTGNSQTEVGKKLVSKKKKEIEEADNPELARKYYRRRDTKVNPFLHHIVARPKTRCHPETYMIVLVHSFHPYKERREAIRSTWGSVANGSQWPNQKIKRELRLVFVLGKHKDGRLNSAVAEELERYDDIVQGDFMDAYTNMTLKSLLGLKYVMEDCPNAEVLLKSDDDMFINLPYLLDILQEKEIHHSIVGPKNTGSKVMRTGKWAVSREAFPFGHYPVYESGAAYVISIDLIRDLYETAEYVPPFHVDDVYITGVLGRILNVTHVSQDGFAFWVNKAPKVCEFVTHKKVTSTNMTPEKLRKMWKALNERPVCN